MSRHYAARTYSIPDFLYISGMFCGRKIVDTTNFRFFSVTFTVKHLKERVCRDGTHMVV